MNVTMTIFFDHINICYWRTLTDQQPLFWINVYGGYRPYAFIWCQSLKHCSNTENGVVCWSLEESSYLSWSITSSSGSPLESAARANTISSSESSSQPANKDKMTWKSGKEMHFVMDNIEIWKTTCEPSVRPWINLHIFTVALKKKLE